MDKGVFTLNDLINFEQKYKLFDKKINNVYFWILIRKKVLDILQQNFEPKIYSRKISKINIIINLLKNDLFSSLKNAKKKKFNKETLIIASSRKHQLDKSNIDIYTHYLKIHLKKQNLDYICVDASKDIQKLSERWILASNQTLLSLSLYFPMLFFNQNDYLLIKKIEDSFFYTFNLKIELILIIKKAIMNFRIKRKYYRYFFSRNKFKRVFIVCSYCNYAILSAAKDYNIKIIELQHGVISNNAVGYHFHENQNVPYFPNEIYLFSKFWINSANFPIPSSNLKVFGFPYFEQIIKSLHIQNTEEISFDFLFISQPTIGIDLLTIAIELSKSHNSLRIGFKLHPRDELASYKNYFETFDNVVNNLTILEHNKYDSYNLVYNSKVIIGIYSTLLFEAIAMSKKTILLKTNDNFMLDKKFHSLFFKIISNPDEIIKIDLSNQAYYEKNQDIFLKKANYDLLYKELHD